MLKDTQITRCPAQDIVLNFTVSRIGAPFSPGAIGLSKKENLTVTISCNPC
jgi:hypothetical protein